MHQQKRSLHSALRAPVGMTGVPHARRFMRRHTPQHPTASVNTRGYETAIRMARSGASVDEIVASCGTTRAEAKLLRRLHECGDPRRADAETMKIA